METPPADGFRDLLDHATDLIQITDPALRVRWVNRAWLTRFSVNPEDVLGLNLLELVHPDSIEEVQQVMRRALGGESIPEFDVTFRVGTEGVVVCSGSVTCRSDVGRPIELRSILRDVTSQRRSREELLRSEANQRALLESTGDPIWSVDREYRLVAFNSAFALTLEALTGKEARVGAPVDALLDAEDAEWFTSCYDRALAGHRFSAIREEDLEGQLRVYELFFNPISSKLGTGGVVVFTRDITRQRRVEEALRTTKKQAEQANLAKSQFLANMSHELRTPLNSVIGFASVLKHNKAGNLGPQDLEFVSRIHANGTHLLELINQILDLSKIEAGRMELHMEAVDLPDLIEETVLQLEAQAEARSVDLRVEVTGEPDPIRTDPSKLRQILFNLVGNALKFTEDGEVVVELTLSSDARTPRKIAVRDTGVGIPPERLHAVFEAFQQAESSTARRFGGTGLGLTISRSLCDLLGYRLTVESEVGRGSVFSIELDGRREAKSWGMGDLEMPPLARWAPDRAGGERELAGRTVLVVDDDADARVQLSSHLETLGARVLTASDGIIGMNVAHRERPDLVTIDLVMPRMNGWQMLDAMRSDPVLSDIPVIVVTVAAEEVDLEDFGSVDVLSKPLDSSELIKALRRSVSLRSRHVLVVDDDPDTRLILQRYLREAGLETSAAHDGLSALKILARSHVDLVLLDLLMPGMDGFAVLERIRKTDHGKDVPVVVLTAAELTEEQDEALADASEVILKADDLETRLRAVLDRHFGVSRGEEERS